MGCGGAQGAQVYLSSQLYSCIELLEALKLITVYPICLSQPSPHQPHLRCRVALPSRALLSVVNRAISAAPPSEYREYVYSKYRAGNTENIRRGDTS